MDKFTVKLQGKPDGYKPCMIDIATHEKLSQLKEDTGVSMTKLVAQMVDFCIERLEIKEEV